MAAQSTPAALTWDDIPSFSAGLSWADEMNEEEEAPVASESSPAGEFNDLFAEVMGLCDAPAPALSAAIPAAPPAAFEEVSSEASSSLDLVAEVQAAEIKDEESMAATPAPRVARQRFVLPDAGELFAAFEAADKQEGEEEEEEEEKEEEKKAAVPTRAFSGKWWGGRSFVAPGLADIQDVSEEEEKKEEGMAANEAELRALALLQEKVEAVWTAEEEKEAVDRGVTVVVDDLGWLPKHLGGADQEEGGATAPSLSDESDSDGEEVEAVTLKRVLEERELWCALAGGAPKKEEDVLELDVLKEEEEEDVLVLDVLEEEEAVPVLPDSIWSDSEYESEEEDEEEMARREADRWVHRRDMIERGLLEPESEEEEGWVEEKRREKEEERKMGKRREREEKKRLEREKEEEEKRAEREVEEETPGEVPFPLNVITDPAEITIRRRDGDFWDGALGRLLVAIGHKALTWGWSL